MYDKSDIVDLKNATWKLIQARDELKAAKEKDLILLTQSVSELNNATQKFIAHFDEFSKITDKVPSTLANHIESASRRMADLSSERFTRKVEEVLENSLSNLKTASWKAEQSLTQATSTLTLRAISMTVAFCLGSILTALAIVWFAPLKTKPILPESMIHTYDWGRIVESAMYNMSKEEERQLKKLLKLKN